MLREKIRDKSKQKNFLRVCWRSDNIWQNENCFKKTKKDRGVHIESKRKVSASCQW